MAESSGETGVPNLNLTAEEKRVYGHLFRQADIEGVGVVTGEVAVKFFEKTRLDSRVLGEIWQIADKENRGFLTPAGFGVVLRLIGHAQAGREPTAELALQQGPVPRFDGIAPTPPPPPPAAALPAQTTGGRIAIPPLTPEKVAQYASLFERQPLQAGNMLPGDQAKSIFEKSGLPNEILGRIWMLADTEHRGALVQPEFVIAMHLLTSMKRGDLRALPTILPAPLYEAATRRGPIGGVIPRQQSPVSTPPVPAVPRQLTGQASLTQMRTGSPLARPPLAAQGTGDWLITPADKSRFDLLYDELDKTKKGFILGEEAVGFFSQSNLPEDVLAQIWDLADFRSEGRLTRDEFAVAMYLIRQQRSKRDSTNTLPATLPPNLIPPSLRSHFRPPTATSAFDPPPTRPQPPQPKPSALDDLFGLDDPQPPAQAQIPVATGASTMSDPFATSINAPTPSSPVRPSPVTSTFKPFIPSSSFGMGLTAQGTGTSTGSGGGITKPAPHQAAFEDDLLGDTDPEISKSLNNETTELANLSNQIGSLTKQMQDVQGQRSKAQNELSQATAQKQNFEQRLTQLRAMYEKEAQDVRSLETQLNASKNETKKLLQESALIDGNLQDLQNQHRQVLTALQADQQENASLKERIRTVNAEIAQLKPQIEKLKSEARQQKGLVAINKKQLATNEGEREKLKTEVEDLTKSNEELARQVSVSSSPVIHQVASPALSTASGNNPFFRRTGSADIAATFASPPPMRSFNDKSFDDVFGPSSQTSTPPPAAAALFKPQNTGTSTGSVGSFATPGSASPTISRQATLAAEPPAPPESRQISSSYLPFGDANETLSLSRQVSPPLSRVSQPEGSEDSQTTPGAQPIEAVPTGQSITSGTGSETTKGPSAASPTEAKLPTSNAQVTFGGPLSDESKGTATNGDSDPFSAVDQAKAKEDFESAFASFKSAQAKPAPTAEVSKPFTTFNSEFPPISELERDDDSDSDSDRGGFDDDFAPSSPHAKVTDKSAGSKPASPTIIKSIPETSSVTGLGSPGGVDMASEKPASPPPSAPTNINKISGSSVDDIFGSVDGPTTHSIAPVPASSQQSGSVLSGSTATTKGAFDDLDDDFEGLEDAKEGSADDDFANISRSGLDDFNPVFDSSPPPSQAKSESVATSGAPFGVESSFDFGSLSTASVASGSTTAAAAAGGPPGSSGGNAKGAADSHDWDAIFAGLDETPTQQSSPPLGSAGGNGTAAAKESSPATGGVAVAGGAARPTAGRALTEDGEHDDPILKNLTSMGYSRQDALQALEKYDYNLERAANYLASQS